MNLNRLFNLLLLIRAKGRDFYPAEWQIRGNAESHHSRPTRRPSRRAIALNELAFKGCVKTQWLVLVCWWHLANTDWHLRPVSYIYNIGVHDKTQKNE